MDNRIVSRRQTRCQIRCVRPTAPELQTVKAASVEGHHRHRSRKHATDAAEAGNSKRAKISTAPTSPRETAPILPID